MNTIHFLQTSWSRVNSWNDGKSQVQACVEFAPVEKIEGSTLYPTHISFVCQSKGPIDPTMRTIYDRIIAGRAHELLKKSSEICKSNEGMAHCGNTRDGLLECACETLNRRIFPELRKRYEDAIIHAALGIINTNPSLKDLNITVFASGGLFGEQVLLFRLIERIKTIFNGSINLYLVDTQYTKNIQNARDFFMKGSPNFSFNWSCYVGKREDLNQFLHEVARCLPTNITVKGAVFGSALDYIKRAQLEPSFCHDLLVGSDIGGDESLAWFKVIKIRTAKNLKNPGLLLIKNAGKPMMCQLSASEAMECSLIRQLGPTAEEISKLQMLARSVSSSALKTIPLVTTNSSSFLTNAHPLTEQPPTTGTRGPMLISGVHPFRSTTERKESKINTKDPFSLLE